VKKTLESPSSISGPAPKVYQKFGPRLNFKMWTRILCPPLLSNFYRNGCEKIANLSQILGPVFFESPPYRNEAIYMRSITIQGAWKIGLDWSMPTRNSV